MISLVTRKRFPRIFEICLRLSRIFPDPARFNGIFAVSSMVFSALVSNSSSLTDWAIPCESASFSRKSSEARQMWSSLMVVDPVTE